jgi:hypothetical protein
MRVIMFTAAAALGANAAAAEERSFDYRDFAAIGVSAGVEAEIKVGGDYSIRAVGDSEELDRLRVEKRGDGLDIGRKPSKFSWGRHRGGVTVYVTLPSLRALDVSSGASADAAGVEAGSFALEASSGAVATIAGSCGALAVDVSSGGDIEAGAFACKTASADASSGGAMDILVSESLVADASSGGSIRVRGAPKYVNIEKSSGGSVRVVD